MGLFQLDFLRVYLLIILLSIYLLASSQSTGYYGFQNSSLPTYSLAMTTIPPRFPHLAPTLLSWLHQVHKPNRICIYIPVSYKRFRKKGAASSMSLSTYDLLMKHLVNNPQINLAIESKIVRVVLLEKDFGPISKLVGVLMEQKNLDSNRYTSNISNCYERNENLPNFWIFGDDDVEYSQYTILKYNYYISNYHITDMFSLSDWNTNHFVLTQFVETYRIFYDILFADGDIKRIVPRHLQGVDTYLISTNSFLNNWEHFGIFHFKTALAIIDFFHDSCPESFYQDDYLVSFLVSLANIPIYTIWNNDKLTSHVEGVSLSNFQMHRDPKVNFREETTKSCIYTYANDIYQRLLKDIKT